MNNDHRHAKPAAPAPAGHEARRAAGRPQTAPIGAAPGQRSGQREATAAGTPAEPDIRPATEWMKGAQTARDLIICQVHAGHSAGQIAARWQQALASYDDTTATPRQREWHAGAQHTAASMIQTWRDIEHAEAGQAQAARDQRQAAGVWPGLEPEAG